MPKDSLKYFYGIEDVPEGSKYKGGFAHVYVTQNKLQVRFIDAEGIKSKTLIVTMHGIPSLWLYKNIVRHFSVEFCT